MLVGSLRDWQVCQLVDCKSVALGLVDFYSCQALAFFINGLNPAILEVLNKPWGEQQAGSHVDGRLTRSHVVLQLLLILSYGMAMS